MLKPAICSMLIPKVTKVSLYYGCEPQLSPSLCKFVRAGQALSKLSSARAPPLFRAGPFRYRSSAHFGGIAEALPARTLMWCANFSDPRRGKKAYHARNSYIHDATSQEIGDERRESASQTPVQGCNPNHGNQLQLLNEYCMIDKIKIIFILYDDNELVVLGIKCYCLFYTNKSLFVNLSKKEKKERERKSGLTERRLKKKECERKSGL